jgi:hypothetical protein
MKKIGILVGAFSLLVAIPVSIARNDKGTFFAQAAPVQGTYSLTIDNTVAFTTGGVGQGSASINKQGGQTTLTIDDAEYLIFTNSNRLPITVRGEEDEDAPSIRLVQVRNIRSVSAVFTSGGNVSFVYRYRDFDINGRSASFSTLAENLVNSNTVYVTPRSTSGGIGNNSYPDELIISFDDHPVMSTLTSLTITYDC